MKKTATSKKTARKAPPVAKSKQNAPAPTSTSQPKNAGNAALAAKTEEIGKLLAEHDSTSAMTMYCVGQEVLSIKSDESKYGKGSVRHVARQLGRTPASLYSYATVAETWSAEDFEGYVARVNSKGQPLTFSHFIELAKVTDGGRRDAMMKEALEESLSVRDIARVNRPLRSKRHDDRSAATVVPAQAAARPITLLAVAAAACEHAQQETHQIEDLLSAGDALPADDVLTSVNTLHKTVEIYAAALGRLIELAAKLRDRQEQDAAE